MQYREISRVLREADDLGRMLDHAQGLGNTALVNSLCDQIERKLDAVQPFIEAAADGKFVPQGFDYELVKNRHAEFTSRLGAFKQRGWRG